MKKGNIIDVCEEYDTLLAQAGYIIEHRTPYSDEYNMNHIRWMVNEIPKLLYTANKQEKANRWLGFVQGVMWLKGFYTIDEMKSHNRSGNEPSNLPTPGDQYYWFEGGLNTIEE